MWLYVLIVIGLYRDRCTVRCGLLCFFFFQAEDGIRDLVRSRGLGDVYKRQGQTRAFPSDADHDTPDIDRQERQGLLADECQATRA